MSAFDPKRTFAHEHEHATGSEPVT
jgi:hypothetical protein